MNSERIQFARLENCRFEKGAVYGTLCADVQGRQLRIGFSRFNSLYRVDGGLRVSAERLAAQFGISVDYLAGICDGIEALHSARDVSVAEDDHLMMQAYAAQPAARERIRAWLFSEAMNGATAGEHPIQSPPSSIASVQGLKRWNSLAVSGVGHVYFLCLRDEVVYVGKTTNLQSRLLDHRQTKEFDEVFFVTVEISELDTVECEWIRTLRPRLNVAHL